MIEDHLSVVDELHRQKLLNGIKLLQIKDKHNYPPKKEKTKEEKPEQAKVEPKKEPKKKKKKKKPAPKTFFGEIREENILDRVKIERELRAQREEKEIKRKKMESKSKTWDFEYTGAPKPQSETIWDNDPLLETIGSKGYQHTMANEILSSDAFKATPIGTQNLEEPVQQLDEEIPPPNLQKVQTVPTNCTPDELLAVIKGSMYSVSNWLIEIEKMNIQREKALDSDLFDDLQMSLQNDYATYLSPPEMILEDIEQQEAQQKSVASSAGLPTYSDILENGEIVDEDTPENELGDDDGLEGPPISYDDALATTVSADVMDEAIERQVVGDTFPGKTKSKDELAAYEFAEVPPQFTKVSKSLQDTFATNYTTKHNNLAAKDTEAKRLDRVSLIFNALVGQKNNHASWLGKNNKLTRLKLYGGLESLLRLRVEWSQFDALWTRLDYHRSGNIDIDEFKAFFGDLSEFEQLEGAKKLALSGSFQRGGTRVGGLAASAALNAAISDKDNAVNLGRGSNARTLSKSLDSLTKLLYELCDTLRAAGFTVVDMFAGFDRNASGEVSVSEFCSLLRSVVGNTFDKRVIYQALLVLDTDGNKSISLQELLRFVYRIWKTQLDDLADKIFSFDNANLNENEAKQLQKCVKERNDIKQAIKKNFPRQWRDRLERENNGTTIPGPFQSLLQRMHVGSSHSHSNSNSRERLSRLQSPTRHHSNSNKDTLDLDSPEKLSNSYSNTNNFTNLQQSFPPEGIMSSPNRLLNSTNKSQSSSTNRAGRNIVKRFKIKMPGSVSPTRVRPNKDPNKDLYGRVDGLDCTYNSTNYDSPTVAKLAVPIINNIGDQTVMSTEATHSILRSSGVGRM